MTATPERRDWGELNLLFGWLPVYGFFILWARGASEASQGVGTVVLFAAYVFMLWTSHVDRVAPQEPSDRIRGDAW